MRLRFFHCLCATIVALALAPAARACTIPVFRYALERWDLSAYELLVFHRGELPKADRVFLDALPNRANIAVRFLDLDGPLSPAHRKLWESQVNPTAPWAILRSPGDPKLLVSTGPLDLGFLKKLVDSPARQRIVKGLSEGDSAVFVLLESGDAKADDATRKLLQRELRKFEELVKLPEQSQSGPRILFALPLKVSLPVMTIKRDDPAEQGFVGLILSSEKGLADAKGPIVFPIFGRGRLLGALWGDDLKAETFYDVVRFLCSECSCEVKEANPGMDLLIVADWPAIFERIGPAPETGPEMPLGVTRLARAKPLAGLLAISPGMGKTGKGLETEVRVAFSHEPQSESPMDHVDEKSNFAPVNDNPPTAEACPLTTCRFWLLAAAGFLVIGTGVWAGMHWLRSSRPLR